MDRAKFKVGDRVKAMEGLDERWCGKEGFITKVIPTAFYYRGVYDDYEVFFPRIGETHVLNESLLTRVPFRG